MTLCNTAVEKHTCICGMSFVEVLFDLPGRLTQTGIPFCKKLIAAEALNNPVAISFNVSEMNGDDDWFNEDKFKNNLATKFAVNKANVVILRSHCDDDNEHLDIEFVVLKRDYKSHNRTIELPYNQSHIMDGRTVFNRLEHLNAAHRKHLVDLEMNGLSLPGQLNSIDGETELLSIQMALGAITVVLAFCLVICCLVISRKVNRRKKRCARDKNMEQITGKPLIDQQQQAR